MSDKRRYSDMDQKSGGSTDIPPYSRIFIICSKSVTENCIHEEFGKFGQIEEVRLVKDRATGESKGVSYVKYALTSSAAKAIEEMNGKTLGIGERPIKVLIAHSRGEGSKKEPLEEERLLRLFVVCRKTATTEELEEHFRQFGQIDNIKLVKCRDSNENKGFAYVKYYKMSHAALAYENCDRSHRPKFAEPKPQPPARFGAYDGYDGPGFEDRNRFKFGAMGIGKPSPHVSYGGESFTKLNILVSPIVSQDQLWRLCDIAPGLEYCRIFPDYRNKGHHDRVTACASYSTPAQAAHARDKLNGFEYPPGYHLTVRPDHSDPQPAPSIPPFPLPGANSVLSKSDIEKLAENVKQATALLRASAGGFKGFTSSNDPNYCTAKLPEPRSFDDEEASDVEARVFVVFNPSIPDRPAIKDVFGRFGKITDMFLLSGKNVGYVTYARKESVFDAINALHGHELCGMYMKVVEADPRRSGGPDEDRRKRLKMIVDE